MELWIEIAELALKYGIPAVRAVVNTWSKDMTPEELKAMREEYMAKLKDPETYFE